MVIGKDEELMTEALFLAEKGRGKVSPNPLVGAVIVCKGEIVGRGYHDGVGRPHAEVNAIAEAGSLARGGTLYVTLEPCSTWGRTPPCTDAIIDAGVARVFVATTDPNPSVSGNGIRALQDAGIEVHVGLMEDEAEKVNEVYLRFMKTGLPFVTLKVAATADGKIATKGGESKWITCEKARNYVQTLRSEVDAILVGVGTVLIDDPSLTVKNAAPSRRPRRIVLDSGMRAPKHARLFDGTAPTIVATVVQAAGPIENAEMWALPADQKGRVSLESLLETSAREGITSILVEGGAAVFSSFLEQRKVDKFVLFIAPKIIGEGIDAFGTFRTERLEEAFLLDIEDVGMLGTDILVTAYPGTENSTPDSE